MTILYGYWRSSATWRVRIALALKGLTFDYRPVNLLKGEQAAASYRRTNPLGLVPALVEGDGPALIQSLAVVEYLEETRPSPPLLPKGARARAKVRAVAQTIACEAQPLQNLRVQNYLRENAGLGEAGVKAFLQHFVGGALEGVERMIENEPGPFCFGDAPTLADICLVPQVYAARRFGVDVSNLARIAAIAERCNTLEPFIKAHPDNQPDAVKG